MKNTLFAVLSLCFVVFAVSALGCGQAESTDSNVSTTEAGDLAKPAGQCCSECESETAVAGKSECCSKGKEGSECCSKCADSKTSETTSVETKACEYCKKGDACPECKKADKVETEVTAKTDDKK